MLVNHVIHSVSFNLVHCLMSLFRILSPVLSISWLSVQWLITAFASLFWPRSHLFITYLCYWRSSPVILIRKILLFRSCFIFIVSLSTCFPPLSPTIIWLGATPDCMYFNWDGDIWANVSGQEFGRYCALSPFLTRTCMGNNNRWCTWH